MTNFRIHFTNAGFTVNHSMYENITMNETKTIRMTVTEAMTITETKTSICLYMKQLPPRKTLVELYLF